MQYKIFVFLAIVILVNPLLSAANRLTTWSAGQILTAANLNNEINNIVNDGTIDRTGGRWGALDDVPITLGTSQDVQIEWETTQTTDSFIVGLGSGLMFNVMEKADMTTNWGIASQTNPTLIVHSADAGTTTDYIWLTHDQTNATINVGGGGLDLAFGGTDVITISATGDWVFGGTTPLLTVGDGGTEDHGFNLDGNEVDFGFGQDDSTNSFVIATGAALGTDNLFELFQVGTGTDVQRAIFYGQNPSTAADADNFYISFFLEDDAGMSESLRLELRTIDVTNASNDAQFRFHTMINNTLTRVLELGAGGASSTTGIANFTADIQISGTTPLITVGDAGTEDAGLAFDGNETDFGFGLDDSTNSLVFSDEPVLGTDNLFELFQVGAGTSVQRAIFYGANTGTPADNDESYLSFYAENDANAQVEISRMSWRYLDVSAADDDSTLTFDVFVNNSFTEVLTLGSSSNTATAGRATITGELNVSGTVTLTTDLTVANGGTGASTFTDGGLLLGSGTGAITALGVATNGQIPIGDGTTDPVLATITGTSNEVSVASGAGSITLSIPDDVTLVTLTLTNDLTVANGGTGVSSLTDGGLLIGSGTGGITALGVATNGQIPIGDGTTDPVLATLTGTASEITVTNGGGTITLSQPNAVTIGTDLTVTDQLIVSGAGPHAIGTSVADNFRVRLGGTFTSGGVGTTMSGVEVEASLTAATGDTSHLSGMRLSTNITTQGATETINTVSQLRIEEPTITVGSGDTVTTSASLYVVGAATEATTNYAGWFDAGDVLIDEDLGLGVTPVYRLDILSGTANTGTSFRGSGTNALAITAADVVLTSNIANIVVGTNDAFAIDKGGSIAFGGRNTTGSTIDMAFSKIKGAKETSGSGNQNGYLAFAMRNHNLAAMKERVRFASEGFIVQDEVDVNPTTTNLDADDSIAIYSKADILVFAYNNGGTITYITIPLDGSTTTWTHGTSAP